MNLDNDKVNEIFDIEPAVETPIQTADEIDVNKVYGELANLIQSGNDILTTAKYMIDASPDNAEQIASVASLLNSLNSMMGEFTKINMEKMKHQQKLELEQIKYQQKLESEQIKHQNKIDFERAKKNISGNGNTSDAKDATDLIKYCQEEIIRKMDDKNNL